MCSFKNTYLSHRGGMKYWKEKALEGYVFVFRAWIWIFSYFYNKTFMLYSTGVTCHRPSIYNGNVTYSSLAYGSRANYSCNKGYAVKGQTIRICDRRGHWSGVAPQCCKLTCPSTTFSKTCNWMLSTTVTSVQRPQNFVPTVALCRGSTIYKKELLKGFVLFDLQ